jgi:hypothetical protein
VLEKAIGIFAVAAIGGAARGLNVTDAVRLGTEHPEESLGRHGSGADLNIVRLLQDATVTGPEILQAKNEFLKRQRILRRSQWFFLNDSGEKNRGFYDRATTFSA